MHICAESTWDFMKEGEIIQWFICFYANKIPVQVLNVEKKRAELLCSPEES